LVGVVRIDLEGGVIDRIETLITKEGDINYVTVMIALVCISTLFMFAYYRRNYNPKSLLLSCGTLFVTIGGSLLVYFMDWERLY